jgi:hypothetical protein
MVRNLLQTMAEILIFSVQTRDFILDNSGLLIYKALPFAIALLHLPYFKDVTEGMKCFE